MEESSGGDDYPIDNATKEFFQNYCSQQYQQKSTPNSSNHEIEDETPTEVFNPSQMMTQESRNQHETEN